MMRLALTWGGPKIDRPPVRAELDYTDKVIEYIERQAAGLNADPTALMLVAACAGIWERCIAAATVEPASGALAGVTPQMLALAGRDLALRGNSIWAIQVTPAGQVLLVPASSFDIAGGPDPASWRYSLDLAGPSLSGTRVYERDSVLHFRLQADAREPWRGASPLQSARLGFDLAAALEKAMRDETRLPVSRIVTVSGGRSESVDELSAKIAEGGVATTDVEGASPSGLHRIQASPSETAKALRSDLGEEICAAFGASPVLFAAQGDGSGQREAWRRFWAGTIAPVGRIIEAELQAQLDPAATVHFRDMRASDEDGMSRAISRRAAAYKTFRDAGIEDAEARRLAGLES